MFDFFKRDNRRDDDGGKGNDHGLGGTTTATDDRDNADGPVGVESAPRHGGYVTDAVGSDPKALEKETGVAGRTLIKALDTAMGWQTSAIVGYVTQLHARHPEETPAEIQERIDKHFMTFVTGSGGAAGGAAVVPGIGFITGLGAIAVESVVFLEAAAWYTLASASLRGIDISEKERRRSLILVTLLGSEGTALVAAAMGDQPLRKQAPAKDPAAQLITRMGIPQLGGLNKMMLKQIQKRITKSARLAVLGKLMPMGIGAVIGAGANRKLGKVLLESNRKSLGAVPRDWPAEYVLTEEEAKKARRLSLPRIPLTVGFIGGKDDGKNGKNDGKDNGGDSGNGAGPDEGADE